MTDQPPPSNIPLQIQTPCSKSWAELAGDEKKRFCSDCSLHVHNAAQLTQMEARALVSRASPRVCMRIEYDASGAPIFSDSQPEVVSRARAPQPPAARLARWALSAAAGLLAACHGSVSTPGANDPTAGSKGVELPSKMGRMCSTVVGDVALPPPQNLERLGEAVAPPDPARPPTPDAPPAHDGK